MGNRKNTALAIAGKGNEDRQFVRALARGLDVLKAFRAEEGGLSNAQIAQRTGFPKPTVSRLTFTLLSLGYLHLDENSGRYSLHPHILTLGFPVLKQLSIREIARPLMQELADQCGGAVSLGVRDGPNMIVIERARHSSMTSVPLDIGIGREIATSAIGRAYLVSLGDPAREKLLDELAANYGDQWPSLIRAIEDTITHFNKFGFTVSAGDWFADYNAVGVPLTLADGTHLAFNYGGASRRITVDQLPTLGNKLVDMVTQLARTQDVKAG